MRACDPPSDSFEMRPSSLEEIVKGLLSHKVAGSNDLTLFKGMGEITQKNSRKDIVTLMIKRMYPVFTPIAWYDVKNLQAKLKYCCWRALCIIYANRSREAGIVDLISKVQVT